MSNVSKTTADRERIINNVVHAVDNHLVPLADEVVGHVCTGKKASEVTVEEFLESIGITLKHNMSVERNADMDVALDELETAEARALRDEIYGNKVERLRTYRSGLQASYGETILPVYGLSDTVPTTAHQLITYADNVALRLAKRPLPRVTRPHMPAFDAAAIASDIRSMVVDLEFALEEVGRETREDQLARERRDNARAITWRSYQALTTVVEGMFRLIDRGNLAERVRLTKRRRAGLPEADDMEFGEPTVTQPSPEEV